MGKRQRPRALLVFEATVELGGGHMARCSALAEALASSFDVWLAYNRSAADIVGRSGVEVATFPDGGPRTYLAGLAVSGAERPDLIVVDHYGVDASDEEPLRAAGMKVVVIDDLAGRSHAADVLIDSNPSADAGRYRGLVSNKCRLLLGGDYALLRPEFRNARLEGARATPDSGLVKVLVSMGATDAVNATSVALKALAALSELIEVTVVLGSSSPNLQSIRALVQSMPYSATLAVGVADMATLYCSHDVAIGAPATSMLERACVGLPSILIETAGNQSDLARALRDRGAAVCLGHIDRIAPQQIAEATSQLIADAGLRARLNGQGQALIDGLGALRVAANLAPDFEARDGTPLIGRRLRREDASIIHAWQSAPGSRRYSRNAAAPTPLEHERWIEGRISSRTDVTEIVELGSEPVAMVRLDERASDLEVSVLVSPAHVGQGIGKASVAYISRLAPGRSKVAWVHPDNAPSLAVFTGCGYGKDPYRSLRFLEAPLH